VRLHAALYVQADACAASLVPKIILTSASPPLYDPRNDVAHTSQGDLAPPPMRTFRPVSPPPSAVQQLNLPAPVRVKEVPSPSIPAFDGEDEPRSAPLPSRPTRHRNQQLRLSKSSPTLTHQLTDRISAVTVFNQATVVHRPHRASRPTVVPDDPSHANYHPEPPFGLNERHSGSSHQTKRTKSSTASSQGTTISTAPTSVNSSGNGTSNPWQTSANGGTFSPKRSASLI
jgi:hypothetical protein